MIRILGKGITAQAIKDKFEACILYDDENFNEYDTNSDEVTVVSPGIPPYNHMVKNSKNIISEYDLFKDKMPFSIWISGTNGKTTTTQMTQLLLEKRGSVCGGNIGTPLAKLDTKANIWVLETSSFTMHYTKYAKPNLYLLLPISEDHISWHGSFEEYKESKLKPIKSMIEGDLAIIPKEYEAYESDGTIITYENSFDLARKFDLDIEKIDFKEPFLLDAILAMCTSKVLFDKVDYNLINSYKVDAHKVEVFEDSLNRVWIDDSKATNIDATINALKGFKNNKIHLILGGDDKGANLNPMFDELVKYDLIVYAIGSNEDRLEELCTKYKIKFYKSSNLLNAVKQIDKNLKNSDVAMLSPAAASLDQFKSYKQRGETFKEAVYSLRKN